MTTDYKITELFYILASRIRLRLGYGFQPRLLLSVSPYEADGFGYTGIVYFVLRFFHLYGIYRTPSNSNNNRLASNPPP